MKINTINPYAKIVNPFDYTKENKENQPLPGSFFDKDAAILDLLSLSEESEGSGDDEFLKCLEIARRIQAGHQVPEKDRKFLAEKQPEMFLRATLLRRVNPEPKKYSSLLSDDEEEALENPAMTTGSSASGGQVNIESTSSSSEGSSEGGSGDD